MALTRPNFEQTITTKVEISDPVILINKNSATDRDLGVIIDRSYLAQPNVALVFKHTDQALHFITTDQGGDTSGSFTVNTKVDVVTGNVNATYYFGNATFLSNINPDNLSGTVASAYIAETVTANSQPNITAVGILSSLSIGGQITGNIIPSANVLYNLGSNTNRFKDLWLSNSTIYIGNVKLSATDTKLVINDVEVLSLYTLSDVNGANVSGQVANALVAGTVYTNSQPNITSVGTLSSLTVTGNVSAGNLSGTTLTGTLSTSTQPNVTSLGTLTNLTVSDYVTANHFNGNGATLSDITGANVTGQVANALVAGTVYTSAQPNITSVGSLTSLVVTGNVSTGNVSGGYVTGAVITGTYLNGTLLTSSQPNITSVGSLTSLSVIGNVDAGNLSGTLVTGTLTTAAQPNITSVGILSSLTVTGNISAGNLSGTMVTGTLTTPEQPNITSVGSLTSLSVIGNVSAGNLSGTLLTGTLTTASQPNITSVGTLDNLSVTGNISADQVTGTLSTAAQPNITSVGSLTNLSVIGNITAGNVSGTLVTGTLTTAAQPNITSVGSLISLSVTGNVSAGNVSGTTLTGTLSTAAQPNITSVGSLTSLSVIGNITADNINSTLLSGTLTTSSQPNITSVGSLTSLSVIGNITADNLSGTLLTGTLTTAAQPNITSVGTLGSLTVSGNVSASFYNGNGSLLSSLTGSNVTGQVANALVAGTVYTNAQPNVTSVGTLTGLTVSGNSSFSNVSASQAINISDTTNATGSGTGALIVHGGASISKDLYVIGNIYTDNLVAITSSTLSVQDPLLYLTTNTPYPYNYEIGVYSHFIGGTGNSYQHTGLVRNHADSYWYLFSNVPEPAGGIVDLANVNLVYDSLKLGGLVASGNVTSGNASLGNLATANYFSGNGSLLTSVDAATAVTVTSASQPAITSLGTLTSLTVSGNVLAGNVSGALLTGTLATAAQPNITSVGALTSLSVIGNVTAGNLSGTLLTGTLTTASQPNITSVGTLTSLSVTGNVSAGNVSGALLTGTLATAAQPNITSVGTLTSLIVSGNVTISSNLTTASGTNSNLTIDPDGIGWLVATSTTPVSFQNALVVSGNITTSSGNFIGNGALLTGLPAGYANTNVASYLPTYSGNIGGTLTTAAQPYITSLGTITGITLASNATISLSGTASQISGANLVSASYLTGTLTTAAQPNITSVGSLTSLTVTGNIVAGNVSGTLLTGTLSTAAQPNITSVGTLTSLIVSGNVTISSNLTTASGTNANLVIDPDGTGWLTATSTTPVSFQNALVVTGNITSSSGNFIGNGALLTGLPAGYSNTNVASYLPTYSGNIGGTLTTAAQPYVTSVGTLSSLSVTANVSAAAATYTGNVTVSNLIATANIVGTAATAVGINTTANANLTLNAGAGQIITLSGVQNGQANTVGNIGNTTGYFNTIFSSAAVHSGAVNVGSIVNNNANTVGNIGSTTGYFNTLFSVAAVHSGSVTLGSIINAGANGSGNIGSSTGYFNTVFAKATSAQYADLAEIYTADLDYIPGTVVIFGGEQEITTTTLSHDTRVAGVISTNPAYLMNSSSNGLPVAFTGRVPCMVRGPVSKGTILVASDIPGVAEAMSDSLYRPGCILGKSLGVIPENDIQLIEVVVGRF